MKPTWAALVVGLLVAGVVVWFARGRRAHTPGDATETSKGMQIPALQANEDETLALDVETDRQAGERRLRLRTRDGGEARLLLRDPGMVGLIDLASGTIDQLQDLDEAAFDFSGAFSPDGARVAIGTGNVTRVYNVGGHRLVASTSPALEASPLRWEGNNLLLFQLRYEGDDEEEPLVTYHRWQPGSGQPRPARAPRLQSPDGRHRLEAAKDGIVITGPGGAKRVAMSRPGDMQAFLVLRDVDNPTWLGPDQVLVHLEEPMALDLPSGKLHYLFPAPDLRFEATTPDGRLLFARDGRDQLLWAQRP